jgi:8-oxo-dGTP diphosphatase
MTNMIKIGCEAFIKKENSILLGLRKNCFGEGTWGLPGGHLEFQEKLVEAVRRELEEEVGVSFQLEDFNLITILDDIDKSSDRHYIHCSFEVKYSGQEIKLMEPDRCAEWKFFDLKSLPDIFPPHKPIIEQYSSDVFYKNNT